MRSDIIERGTDNHAGSTSSNSCSIVSSSMNVIVSPGGNVQSFSVRSLNGVYSSVSPGFIILWSQFSPRRHLSLILPITGFPRYRHSDISPCLSTASLANLISSCILLLFASSCRPVHLSHTFFTNKFTSYFEKSIATTQLELELLLTKSIRIFMFSVLLRRIPAFSRLLRIRRLCICRCPSGI